jgi:hypothetical protein
MSEERDQYRVAIDAAERMPQVMLGLYDLLDEAGQADFDPELLDALYTVLFRVFDEFRATLPSIWAKRGLLAAHVPFPPIADISLRG